jgi:hypothetical protein
VRELTVLVDVFVYGTVLLIFSMEESNTPRIFVEAIVFELLVDAHLGLGFVCFGVTLISLHAD